MNREPMWFIANNGEQYLLTSGNDRVILQEEGFGMPDIEWITQRSPFQHGETIRDYFLRPRTIQLLYRQDHCSRDVYWQGRNNIIDILRPNRSPLICDVEGVIRRRLPDGSKWDLSVVASEGPRFPFAAGGGWDHFAIQEVIRFTAYNPVFFNPVPHSVDVVFVSDDLVFPITFPIAFTIATGTNIINYAGNWMEFPTVYFYGPLRNPVLTNTLTGYSIGVNYDIPTGRSVRATLTYGAKSIIYDDGTDLIGYALGDYDVFGLSAQKVGVLNYTPQIFTVQSSIAPTGLTKVTLVYYDRRLAL